MPKFKLYAGLGGGFGGAQYHTTMECNTQREADHEARELAVEEYESYAGYHGLLDVEEVRQDLADSYYEGDTSAVPEEEVEEAYVEEMEGWLVYYAKEVTSDSEDEDDED